MPTVCKLQQPQFLSAMLSVSDVEAGELFLILLSASFLDTFDKVTMD
jgi:hypothetical protein